MRESVGTGTRGPGRRRAGRHGHSLPELIVAVAFLAATVAAVGGTAVLGGRLVSRAARTEEAVRIAGRILDSLSVAPGSVPGSLETRGLRVSWGADEDGGLKVVVTSRPAGRRVVVLRGFVIPNALNLPDEGQVAVPPTPPGPVSP